MLSLCAKFVCFVLIMLSVIIVCAYFVFVINVLSVCTYFDV